jgi:hypothetical protein
MEKITKKLESTAYHEAGHAVMAYHVRRRFKYVTIEQEEDSLGHILLSRWPKGIEPGIDSGARVENYLKNSILIDLAGHAAERLFKGRNNWVGSRQDVQTAVEFADYVCGSNEESQAYVKWLFIKARNIIRLEPYWDSIKALAKELLIKKKIGYMAARKIIKDASEKKG